MSVERWRRVRALFDRVVDLPPSERGAVLDTECGADADLRREVEELLAADSGVDLVREAVGREAAAVVGASGDAPLGRRFGAYEIVGELGRGGMSTVFRARRADDEFEREVALKVVRGLLTDDGLERFRQERQVLASLEHPNIARLLDGGTTEDGVPYLVMELVDGVPIDRFCDYHRLDLEARLELFRKVCRAVQYAHRNLVVHRDLKPHNILVDQAGEPKLLDFGIAKLIGPGGSEATVQLTGTLERFLTPRYASPEQVRGQAITTSSDVYSLGVLLYELLVGSSPYELESHSAAELEQQVCVREPTRPSSAVGATGRAVSVASALRGDLRAAQLARKLKGDLDTIVLTAMRKEPERRYASVEQLEEDIRRSLSGLPIAARPDTVRYRTARFVRRHRWAVAAALGFLLLLSGFATTMAVQSVRLARERDRAIRAESRAQREAATAGRVSDFLSELFRVPDPGESRGASVTAREILDAGAERIDAELAAEPAVRQRLLAVMGDTYRNLGLFDDAARLLERASAVEGDEIAPESRIAALQNLGAVRYEQGDLRGAREIAERTLVEARAELGDDHLAVALSLNDLGWLESELSEYEDAVSLHREALAIRVAAAGEKSEAAAESYNNLGVALLGATDFDGAESALERAIAIREEILGEDHPATLSSLNNLAVVLHERGDLERAEKLYRRTVATARRVYGEDNPQISTFLVTLGRLLAGNGELDEAEQVVGEALALDRRRGEDHFWVGYDLMTLGGIDYRRGAYDRAADRLRSAIEIYEKTGLEAEGYRGLALRQLGVVLLDQGRPERAEPLLRESLAIRERELDSEHTEVAMSRLQLGRSLVALGRRAEGEPLIRAGHRVLTERFAEGDARRVEAERALAALEKRDQGGP